MIDDIYYIKDSVYRVIDEKGKDIYVECSVCSKDKEFWPEGSIKTCKERLRRGTLSCGCAFNPKYTERQHLLRLKRRCEDLNFEIISYPENFKGVKTKVRLLDKNTSEILEISINKFFRNGFQPAGRFNSRRREDFDNINRKNIKELHKGYYDIKRSGRGYSVKCSVCSSDTFVENGMCSGVFETTLASLKSGHKPCRCKRSFDYTKEQYIFILTEQLKKECGQFLGFWTKDVKAKSKFKWICNSGHTCITTVNKFRQGQRCKICAKFNFSGENGFYKDRVNNKDYLYVVSFGGDYLKVGRAFDFDKRLRKSSNCLVKASGYTEKEIELLGLYTDSHGVIFESEQWIHEQLRDRGFWYYHEDFWTIEAFTADALDLIKRLITIAGLEEVPP